jgi:hypothetical protein
MPNTSMLPRRIARPGVTFRAALVLALLGCDNSDAFDPETSAPPDTPTGADVTSDGLAAASFAGGIPMGTFAQPTNTYGDVFNGGWRNIWPSYLRGELAAIKSRGGKVVLMLAGNHRYYKDAQGHFSLEKWKARVNRFRNINFASFITDGTVIGHYMMDEPNDPRNWGGRPVPASTVEEMARYSKQLWPGMTTIVRVDPGYLGYNHRYLNAAWAQYVTRKGTPSEYIRRNVADAQDRGLALITGLNILRGGPNGSKMSPTQVREWGTRLLESSYPCAFISWQYRSEFSSGSMRDAMRVLRNKAENRSPKSCRR